MARNYQRKHYTDGVDREALEGKICSYFTDKSFAKKILDNPMDLFFFVPSAYNLFTNNPEEFQDFYSEKFRKEATNLDGLSDREKYGVLIVKARQLYNSQQNEDFLSGDFKEIPNLNFPVKRKGTKSTHFGKFYND